MGNIYVNKYKKQLKTNEDWYKMKERTDKAEKFFETVGYDNPKYAREHEHYEAMGLAMFEYELFNGWMEELLTPQEIEKHAKEAHGVNVKLNEKPKDYGQET